MPTIPEPMQQLAAAQGAAEQPEGVRPQAFVHTSKPGGQSELMTEMTDVAPPEGMTPQEQRVYLHFWKELTVRFAERLNDVEKKWSDQFNKLQQ